MNQKLHRELYNIISSMIVLRQKTHSYHWLVRSTPSFVEIHTLFGQQYDQILLNLDRLAEHLVINRLAPPLTLVEALKASSIDEAKSSSNVKQMLEELAQDHAKLSEIMSNVRDTDRVTDNILAEFQEYHDKQNWFLRSY